jgi:NADH:ubiquinone reductase (non-electrogenic)
VTKARVLVLGSGFAAFSFLRAIDLRWYDVTIVSPRNHFLFTPLLPSTAVGTIEFRSIIEPVRIAKGGVQYYQAACSGIDFAGQTVRCENALDDSVFTLPYDILVIGVGAANNTFNVPGVTEFAFFLKGVSDARAIRQRIIDCFERASTPGLPALDRKRLLHFVIVGGGPTGVEFAAELHDFIDEDLQGSFPLLVGEVRITLLEAMEQILNTFDTALSEYTMRHFQRQRINVVTGSSVVMVEETKVYLKDGSEIQYGLLVWSTGNAPQSLIRSLTLDKSNNHRLLVDEYLRLPAHHNVYALGDCATFPHQNIPATAQVAQQQGAYLARALNRAATRKHVGPFRAKDWGMLAYVGSNRALADLATVKGRGFTTFLFWRSAYLTRLVSWKNKILVLFDWFKTLVFGRDISRI